MTAYDRIEEDSARLIFCTLCKAEPGHWCRTRSDKVARQLHSQRTYVLYELWNDGYLHGERDGLDHAVRMMGEVDGVNRTKRYLASLEKNIREVTR